MKTVLPPPARVEDEISALTALLQKTGRRLEELTAGQVDSVVDHTGRVYLFKGVQAQLRNAEESRQAAILNALPAHIALLDARGLIVSVNDAWRNFASANALHCPGHAIGANYLDICDRARGEHSAEARQAAAGLRSVMSGSAKSFSFEYPRHSAEEQRWFLMTAAPLASGAVVMHLDITERKRNEEELRRFAAAMDATVDAIYLVDRSTMRFVHVNDAACRMQSRTREELLALGPDGLLSIPREELERTYDAIIASGVEAAPLELPRRRKDGSEVWVEIRRHAQLAGDRWMIVTLVRDVTERRKAAQQLHDSEQRFRSLTKLSSDWFWEQDEHHRFVRFSGGEGVKGWGPDQNKAVGLHRWDLAGVVPISCGWQEHKGLLEAHKPFRKFEYSRILGDGRLQYVEASGEPIFDAAGGFTGYRGVATEITERKLAEQDLQRFRAAMDSSGDAIVLVDRASMRYVDVNQTLCDMVGYTRQEVIGMTPMDLFGAKREVLERDYDAIIANKGSTANVVEGRYRHKNGSLIPVETRRRATRADKGWIIVGSARDITDRKITDNKILYLNRVYAMLSEINALIVRVDDRAELFREACRIAVETGGFHSAWIGVVDRSALRIVLTASAGVDKAQLAVVTNLFSSSDGVLQGTTLAAQAVRRKKAFLSNDSQNDPAVLFGKTHAHSNIRSMAMLPLIVADEAIAVLALYASETDFFNAREVKLLTELADNIAFAIDHIRKEAARREAEARVVRLNRVYAVLSGINTLIVRVRDRDELFKEACRIAVEAGRFSMAWIGVVDRKQMKVIPVTCAGADPGFLATIKDRFNLPEDAPGGNTLTARAVRGRKAVISNDLLKDSTVLFGKRHIEGGTRAMAVLPLLASNDAVGVLALYSNEVGFFDDEELKLLTELAGDIAFAIEHIEKAGKLTRTTRVNAMLSGINSAIVRIRDRKELFEEACRIAVETGGLPFAWLGVVDETEMRLRLVASAGGDPGFLTTIGDRLSLRDDAPAGHGIGARSVREKRALAMNDVATDSYSKYRKSYAERGIKSVAAFPLFIAGRAAGTFALHAAEIGFFDEDEMKLLGEVAGNIAFALEHIEKEEKVRRLTRVYAVLSGINSLIVRARDRDELFSEACRIAVEAGHFLKVWIGIVDGNSKRFKLIAAHGGDPEFFRNLEAGLSEKFVAGSGLVIRAVQTRQPVISNDAANDPEVLLKDAAIASGVRSVAILPLVVAGEAAGVLALNSEVPGFFDNDEMKLLVELAGDIAFAIDHIAKQDRLDYLAYYDALTGLANRGLFLERVAQYMRSAVSGGHKLALFFLDVERFRNINDSLGRPAGDELLKQVAQLLTSSIGDASLLAHLGADHFAVVLPQVKQGGDVARLLDKKMRAFHDHPFRVGETELRLTIRVGVALFPNDGTDADTLLKNADGALKNAKARGERLMFYTQKMTDAAAGKLTLENQLRQALDQGEFVLHYQPKVSLESGRLTSAEALIRWNDPRTGLVPPGRFIPALEETGLIYDVGRWALRKAIEDYLRWRAAGLPAVRIAVNVSPLQLRNRGFVAEIQQAIGIDAQAAAGVELEITESLIMEDVKNSIASLQAIRAMGVTIAIDDFGTGFSSLAYLARLPVDTLKIDRSFVIDMTAGPDGLALVSTIINLAHSLRLKVVAEGVETEEQARLLRLLSCDEMQGFLFSKAVPAETFEAKFLALSAPANGVARPAGLG